MKLIEPFWVVLRESRYLIRFEAEHAPNNKPVVLKFKVFNGYESGGPPYIWGIVNNATINHDTVINLLSNHANVQPFLLGHIGINAIIEWSLSNGMVKGFSPDHARDMHDIFACIYHYANMRMTLTGFNLLPLPRQALIIPSEYEELSNETPAREVSAKEDLVLRKALLSSIDNVRMIPKCTCLSDRALDAYGPRGSLSGHDLPPPCAVHKK